MTKLSRITSVRLAVFALAGLAWWLLGFSIVSPAERFYLLVPPVFLLAFLLWLPEPGRRLREQVRPALFYLVGLTIACVLLYVAKVRSVLHDDSVSAYLQPRFILPLLGVIYFLLALSVLILLPARGMHWLCQRVGRRLSRRAANESPGRLASAFYSLMPIVIILPLLLPYLLGVTFVHRFKVPNPQTPLELARRSYDDVAFETSDGYTIRGWFLPHDEASTRTMLICHGLGANRSNFMSFHKLGRALAANLLFIDFRGHGDSDGHTVTFGHREKLDVLAAIRYLREDRTEQAREIIGFGISMGTSGLVLAAAEVEPPLDALILDSPFASAVELTDSVLGAFPPLWRPYLATVGVPIASLHAGCDLASVRPIDSIAQVRCPVFIIHAVGDKLIPVDHAKRMHAAAEEPKGLWISTSPFHGGSWGNQDDYCRRVQAFLDAEISPEMRPK